MTSTTCYLCQKPLTQKNRVRGPHGHLTALSGTLLSNHVFCRPHACAAWTLVFPTKLCAAPAKRRAEVLGRLVKVLEAVARLTREEECVTAADVRSKLGSRESVIHDLHRLSRWGWLHREKRKLVNPDTLRAKATWVFRLERGRDVARAA